MEQKENIVQIILGAGRPFSGQRNSSLAKVSNDARVLDWSLQAVKFLAPEVHFIAGYQIDDVVSLYPDLNYAVNSNWNNTGPIMSLLEANIPDNAECIVSYGDILFREKTVKELVSLDADIAIAVDSLWKQRFSSRTAEDMARSEKVVISDDLLLDSHRDISEQDANAEFIGLILLKPEVMQFVRKSEKSFPPEMREETLIGLIDFLRKSGFQIKAVDVMGDWAELNVAQDLANFILGTKAQSLKRLEKVITLSRIAPQVSLTVSEWIVNPRKIIDEIQDEFKEKQLIVRSSAISEDGFDNSNAGAYDSVLGVDGSSEKNLVESIDGVISSYKDGNLENQVLVQPMIEDVLASGVAFTRTLSESAPYYVVNFDDSSSNTDTITSGSSGDHKTLVVLRDNADLSDKFAPEIIRGLVPALQEIENLLAFNALDIEFAIDSKKVKHILQIRPLTSESYHTDNDEVLFDSVKRARRRFRDLQIHNPFVVGKNTILGVMPDWNPAEIIGTMPQQLSFDLYRYLITDEVWAAQRAEYGYRDVRPQPLLTSILGRPYVDVRASFNSFIPANLSDDLATKFAEFYLRRLRENPQYHDKVEFEVIPTCYAFDFGVWVKILKEGGFSEDEIEELSEGLRNITRNAISRTDGDLKKVDFVKQRFEKIASSDLPPLDKALTLLEDCRRYGTLVFAHLARSAFVSVTLLKSAVDSKIISQAAMDSFLSSIETVAHEFVADAQKVAEQKKTWSSFVDRYGHLRPGTYDIKSEAYKDNVEKYLRPVVEQEKAIAQDPIYKDNVWSNERKLFAGAMTEMGLDADPEKLESFLRSSIEGREYAKFIFSQNLSLALDLIAKYGEMNGLNTSQMADVSLGTLFSARSGSSSAIDSSKWLAQEAYDNAIAYEKSKQIELPPLICDETDFSIFSYPSTQPNYVGSGRISANVATLGRDNRVPDKGHLDEKILLIPQADPGFDWIFGHNIVGLITMYGGGNSHMAIRANEFGLPAAIGVGEALYEILSRSEVIELDVTNRKIDVIR